MASPGHVSVISCPGAGVAWTLLCLSSLADVQILIGEPGKIPDGKMGAVVKYGPVASELRPVTS